MTGRDGALSGPIGWTRKDAAAPGAAVSQFWHAASVHRDAHPDFFALINSARPGAEAFLLVYGSTTTAPDALLIGRIELRSIKITLGYASVKSPKIRILEIIHGGAVNCLDRAQTESAVAVLAGMLARREIDAVCLQHADTDSLLFKDIAAASGFFMRDRSVARQPHHFRTLGGKHEFLTSLSQNERSHQRKRYKRLAAMAAGNLRIDELHEVATLDRLLTDVERIAAKSYQRRIGVGFASSAIMEQRLVWLANKSWLRAWIVYIDAIPAAFWIGTINDGVFVSDFLAYDSAFSHLAPGAFLTIHVLSELQSVHSSASRVDFGPGEAVYKQRFGTDVHDCATIYLFGNTATAFMINSCRTIAYRLGLLAKAALTRRGGFEKFKRLCRVGNLTQHKKRVRNVTAI